MKRNFKKGIYLRKRAATKGFKLSLCEDAEKSNFDEKL